MTNRSSGFSLIELLVVIAIIGVLSATATVMYSSYSASAKTTSAKNIMQQVLRNKRGTEQVSTDNHTALHHCQFL